MCRDDIFDMSVTHKNVCRLGGGADRHICQHCQPRFAYPIVYVVELVLEKGVDHAADVALGHGAVDVQENDRVAQSPQVQVCLGRGDNGAIGPGVEDVPDQIPPVVQYGPSPPTPFDN